MKRRIRRKEKKQKKIIITLSIFLILFLTVGYAAFQSNITLKAKGNIKEKIISISDLIKTVVTSGDGLYVDDTETGRYIYKGATPNNYIKLDSDIYRIISIESDGTLKVIKNSNIGWIVLDPSYITNIPGVTDKNSTEGTRYTTVLTDYCYQNPEYESKYTGCNVWGSRTTTLDSSGNNITQMPSQIGKTLYDLPEKEAYLNTYLNYTWFNTLSTDVQRKIVTHIFNVGVVNYSTSLNETITQESSYKWKGKVGLMNASDYIKASTNSTCTSAYAYMQDSNCYNNSETHNWIFAGPVNKQYAWTITPSNVNYSANIIVATTGGIGQNSSQNDRGISPVFFLSSNVNLKGRGTINNPYKII